MSAPSDPGFGVYIHWPFCAQKCPYCDFNSHVRHQGWDEPRFLAAYLREIDHVRDQIGARTVSSIFFGGGTPSLMKPSTTAAILDHIAASWTIAPGAEITLEANPGSVEAGRFAGYKAAGVNRISMGLQSLRDDQLKRLGRIHTVDEAKAALAIARRTFDRVSFDLIYARPGQTPNEWRAELDEALDLAQGHLSLYQLTIEPNTPFAALHHAGKLVVPDGDAAHEMYEITQERCEAAGLPAYEISNHAAAGEESRHNLVYWRYGEYAGIGPGAHGRVVIDDVRHATSTERSPEAWAAQTEANGHGTTSSTALSRDEEADEMLLMGLRLWEGLDLDRMKSMTGYAPSRGEIDYLVGSGHLEYPTLQTQKAATLAGDGGFDEIRACIGPAPREEWPLHRRIRATRKGRFILNELVLRLSRSFEPVAAATRAVRPDGL